VRLRSKLLLSVAAAAFAVGFAPSIAGFLSDYVSFSFAEGFSLNPEFFDPFFAVMSVVKEYAWHILVVYALIIGFIIFLEGQNPDRTILWLITLVLLPGIGLILYMILGPDMRHMQMKKKFRPVMRLDLSEHSFTTDKRYLLARMLHICSGADMLLHNEIEFYTDGESAFSSMKSEIESAKRYIHMQYYIIKDDNLGREISNLLAEAAERGVRVRLLYDAVGSWRLDRSFITGLQERGIECHSFMPMSFPRFRRKMNFRNHRKITVIDGEVAFTGGMNIGDEYLGLGKLGNWRDTAVRIKGEAVRALDEIFLKDWCVRHGENACNPAAELLENIAYKDDETYEDLPMVPLQVIESGTDSAWHSISRGYFGMITRARSRIWITTPYLVPGPHLINAITSAALAGVDTRLMLPAKRDHFLVYWGSRSQIEYMLRAGVRIFLYENGFIHAKTLVADDDICSVGTCNMDIRSLEINFENQLFIYSNELNAEMAEHFTKDMTEAREVKLEDWVRRPMWQKVLESFGRLYSAQI
jgi:cardiolipin synthase